MPLSSIIKHFNNATRSILAEFPGVEPTEIEPLTQKIKRIAELIFRGRGGYDEEINSLWLEITSKINSPEKAKQLDLPIRMLLWRNYLASIAEINESVKSTPAAKSAMPEEKKPLLEPDVEAAIAEISEDPTKITQECIRRLDELLRKNFPEEHAQAKSSTCGDKVRHGLSWFVKIIAPPAAFGAGLTAASIPRTAGYDHPALNFISLALGIVTFGSIYMGAQVELVSFKTSRTATISLLCIAAAIICSVPSAVLNYEGVEGNIKSPPIGWDDPSTNNIAYGCGFANYAANIILGQGQLLQVWILFNLWKSHYESMPSVPHKMVFIFRKILSLGVCTMSMLCYVEAGRQFPSIENPIGSYVVSFLKNITDFSTIILASSQLPWGSIFSSPMPWRSRIYQAITGFSIGAILAKYTYDDRSKMIGGFFEHDNALLILLASTFILNQHYYYSFGKYLQWLVEDIVWGRVLKGIGKTVYWLGQGAYSRCYPQATPPTPPPDMDSKA